MWKKLINKRPAAILGKNFQVERVGHSGESDLYSKDRAFGTLFRLFGLLGKSTVGNCYPSVQDVEEDWKRY